jgi:hypothetical protein
MELPHQRGQIVEQPRRTAIVVELPVPPTTAPAPAATSAPLRVRASLTKGHQATVGCPVRAASRTIPSTRFRAGTESGTTVLAPRTEAEASFDINDAACLGRVREFQRLPPRQPRRPATSLPIG